ncbi:pentapeptide repeat-containing protein [Rhodovulum kholense]|uniref:Pentapeptide repeat protein n=1 Tax=Rhodovulum kholense TaxID=453584 RepID=A0A8E3ARM0_9RHOB|nr:pentapeptide repeat-containing protein [Rhodovulum kholense]PTW49808.1 pentapeptide repeat protein [Rhodovulum kholense]
MPDKRPDLIDWLGYRNPPDFAAARRFGRIVGFALPVLALILIAGTLIAFVIALIGLGDFAAPERHSEAIRNVGLVLAGLIGVPFLVWRSIVAQKQVDVAEQGLITDRLNKAVEGLGAEKTVKRRLTHPDGSTETEETTEPNIEVRIGAIYALERISRDSDRDHVNVMEILCAYIRQNAPASSARNPEDDGIAPVEDLPQGATPHEIAIHLKIVDERTQKLKDWAAKIPQLRNDVRTALEVIGRRDKDRIALERSPETYSSAQTSYILDLRETNLQRANLENLDFSKALFNRSRMESSNLFRTNIAEARFYRTRMDIVSAPFARMHRAEFQKAHLHGANFLFAFADGADFSASRMEAANLTRAKIQGSNFDDTRLTCAHLKTSETDEETSFVRTLLFGTAVKYADFLRTPLTQDQIDSTFGDGSTSVDNVTRPAHWPEQALDPSRFREELRKWRADPASYVPPQDRA